MKQYGSYSNIYQEQLCTHGDTLQQKKVKQHKENYKQG